MSNRLLVAPALIVKRTPLIYRGLWLGPDDFHGSLLVESRAGARQWIDVQALLDGGWDGQPVTTAMLAHVIGMWGASSLVIPGSQTWTATGSHVVSRFNRLEVAVWGGGGKGGGGSGTGINGNDGNQSSYVSSTPVTANGGGGGQGSDIGPNGGAGGTATGGDTNTTGTNGSNRGSNRAGAGGPGASGSGTLLGTLTGGAGGPQPADTTGVNGNAGSAPGGGGSGADGGGASNCGSGGGGGGLGVKLWSSPGASGAPVTGQTITTTVGATQTGGGTGNEVGGDGARGEIRAQWD